jgi:hypothetical protein
MLQNRPIAWSYGACDVGANFVQLFSAGNILYGNLKASNMQIKEAVDIANASEFIESQTLPKQFDDNAASLRDAFVSEAYKHGLIEDLGESKYQEQPTLLKKLAVKEAAEGKFEPVKNELKMRTLDEMGPFKLHPG